MPSAARDDILNVSAPEKCQSLCLPEKLMKERKIIELRKCKKQSSAEVNGTMATT